MTVPIETVAIEVMPADPMSADAQACLDRYFAEIASRFPGGFDRLAGGATAVEDFNPPTGCLLLARLGEEPVGCGAIRSFSSGVGEIKRMWVSPQVRGLGVGGRLLRELELFARNRQWRAIRLDTNASLTEAIGLYLRSGYREIDRFNDNPYAQRWFEKTLE
jgi:ribosomal protein S18 acetylase RimI-like enzyme